MRMPAIRTVLAPPDDQVMPFTRWLAGIIVPFLVVAFVILFLFPDHTQALFAWAIRPRMSAMMLGAAYLGGAYFFTRAARDARWHWVHVGFLPVATFATLLGIATILHWDRFNHGHIAFVTWATLYFTTPFLVLFAWLRNRSADRGTPDLVDRMVPTPARLALGILGVLTILVSLLLFLQPQRMLAVWPWQLTPLTARVVGALFALTGVGELTISLDARWSAVRIPFQSLLIGLTAICIAILFSWTTFSHANPWTPVFVASMFLLLVACTVVYARLEGFGFAGLLDRLAASYTYLVELFRPKSLPAHLGTSARHYQALHISPQQVAIWEDGMRTDGGKGSYEWWYVDVYLEDGAKLAITFRTKPIVEVGKPLEPWIDFNLEHHDGTSIVKHLPFTPSQFSASKEQCAVVMGPNTFRGDLHSYAIHVEAEGVVADIQLSSTTPAWRPATGCLFFGEREEYIFAWLPAVPQGHAVVMLALEGAEPRTYTGIGYHDHNWGNISMLKLMHDWYWARGTIGPYSVIASYITAEQRYGSATFPVFMLARDGKILADDGSKVRFEVNEVVVEPDTGKPVANEVRYRYTDGRERYDLTFTRNKDLLHYKFIDELHGAKRALARLIGVNGAYLRIGGDVKLEHYQNNVLIDTCNDEAVWELMYFGNVPRAHARSEP